MVSGRCADLNPAVRVTMIVVGAGLVVGWRPNGWCPLSGGDGA